LFKTGQQVYHLTNWKLTCRKSTNWCILLVFNVSYDSSPWWSP